MSGSNATWPLVVELDCARAETLLNSARAFAASEQQPAAEVRPAARLLPQQILPRQFLHSARPAVCLLAAGGWRL